MTKTNKHGFLQTDWERAKNEAREILIDRARKPKEISYSELSSMITSVRLDARDRRFSNFLDEISREEDKKGHGMLTVFVVHKNDDMRPGKGFFELAEALDRDTSDKEECWVKEYKRVQEYWASNWGGLNAN